MEGGNMKKLIEFSEEDMIHIATIKERYGLKYDVDAIKFALDQMASGGKLIRQVDTFESQVQREVTTLAAKEEAKRRYAAYKAETQTTQELFDDMGL
jgi:hypothetical protein